MNRSCHEVKPLSTPPVVALLGDVNLDLVLPVVGLPPSGEEAATCGGALILGGSIAHTARWLAAQGIAVRLVGCVGRDPLGELAVRELRRASVPTRWLQRTTDTLTGVCCVMVEPDGQRTMLGLRGANARLARDHVDEGWLAGVDWLHISGYALLEPDPLEAALWAVGQARCAGIPVSLDPGMVVPRHGRADVVDRLGTVDLLLPNAEEAEGMTGEREPERAAAALRIRAGTVLVKCGGRGCIVMHDDVPVLLVPPTVSASDATGAGDAFDAGAIAAALWGGDVWVQGLMGNLLGALATRDGPAAPALAAADGLTLLDAIPDQTVPPGVKEAMRALAVSHSPGGGDGKVSNAVPGHHGQGG